MSKLNIPDNPYILLTPGPLSTSKTVREAMLRDWCTWDTDYNEIVESIRAKLVALATDTQDYTSVLMQGSGSFCIEAAIGSCVGKKEKLLVLANGVYGKRIAITAERLSIPYILHDSGETGPVDMDKMEQSLKEDKDITHVAVVHCETTTGRLNDIDAIGKIVKDYGKTYIVDAMSSFGGIPMKMEDIRADVLISSANKCIQGVPGFGFIIAKRQIMETCEGKAKSLSLDMYDQWHSMEEGKGKWRFTSPTHVVRAFSQALMELEEEGGVEARFKRYSANQRALVKGFRELGLETLLPDDQQSPIITAFISPDHEKYSFKSFYDTLKAKGFVIYPGKVTNLDTFRVGNIGEVYLDDIKSLIQAVSDSISWK